MQMSYFAYLNTKLKENVSSYIWYQLCQSMLNIGCEMFCSPVLWIILPQNQF